MEVEQIAEERFLVLDDFPGRLGHSVCLTSPQLLGWSPSCASVFPGHHRSLRALPAPLQAVPVVGDPTRVGRGQEAR